MDYIYFPKTEPLPDHLKKIIDIFRKYSKELDSFSNDHSNDLRLHSNDVLKVIEHDMSKLGYKVEKSKKSKDKIRIPVIFGMRGDEHLAFEADGYSKEYKTVVEIEAGRAVVNYQFLKDIFQASMMVSTDYLVLAVRKIYKKNKDFEKVLSFIDAIYLTGKIRLDLKGILLVGY